MGLTKLVLRRPVSTVLAILCLIVFGLSSVMKSPLELMPDMNMSMMIVMTVYSGASPDDVSELVTKPIEDRASTLSGLDTISSQSKENMSIVMLKYKYGTDMNDAYDDLKKQMDLAMPEAFESITGAGIITAWKGWKVAVGNRRLLNQLHVPVSQDTEKAASEYANTGKTPMYVVIDGRLAGIVCVADTIKETSVEAVEKIKSLGVAVYMVTGDNEKTAQYIGKLAHVDQVVAEVLPEDKAQVVNRLQNEGKTVMMVGDGINDAPALVQADVGCAVGDGSDIALESGDVVLMKSDLMDVYRAVKLSKATIRNIKQNLFWAFFYNSLGIPVAAGVLYLLGGPLLSPMLGGFAMSLSSVCVVGNALRLRNLKL